MDETGHGLSAEVIGQLDSLRSAYQSSKGSDKKVEQAYLSGVLSALSTLSTCFWCKYGRYAADCIPCLMTLPGDNPYTMWFKHANSACLSSCRSCISEYYQCRTAVMDALSRKDRSQVEAALQDFDTHRLKSHLSDYVNGAVDHKNHGLIFSIFEALIYAPLLDDDSLVELLGSVLHKLADSKKTLKLGELFPGVLFGALSKNGLLKAWCLDRLQSGELKLVSPFVTGSFDLHKLVLALSKVSTRDSLIVLGCVPPVQLQPSVATLDYLLALAQKDVDYLKIIFHVLSHCPNRDCIPLSTIDAAIRIVVHSPLEGQFEVSRECPSCWLTVGRDDLLFYSAYFVLCWMKKCQYSRHGLLKSLTEWMSFKPDLPLALIVGICSDCELLQEFTPSLLHLAAMLCKRLEPLQSVLSGRQTLLLSNCLCHLINRSVAAIHGNVMAPMHVPFANAFLGTLIGFQILNPDDLLNVAAQLGQAVMQDKKRLVRVDFARSIVSRLEWTGHRLEEPTIALIVLYGEEPMVAKAITGHQEQFSKLLAKPWDSSCYAILRWAVLKILPPIVEQSKSWALVSSIVVYLARAYEDSASFLHILSSAIACLRALQPDPAQKKAVEPALVALTNDLCVSLKQRANISAASAVLASLIGCLADFRVEIQTHTRLSLWSLVKSGTDGLLKETLVKYEKTMHPQVGAPPIPPPPQATALNDENAARPVAQKRLIDSMQSRVVQIVPAKPPSKLDSIRSELVKMMPSASHPKKHRMQSMQSGQLAMQPSTRKRVAHSTSPHGAESNSSDEDGGLGGVKEALRAHTETRSVKLVNVETSSLNPEVARLLPKTPTSGLRDTSTWHKLQRFVLTLDYDGLSDDTPRARNLQKTPIPTLFRDFKEYQTVFEPLLFMELEAQVTQAKDELEAVDDRPDEAVLTVTAVHMVDDFHEINFVSDERAGRVLSDLDVVVVEQVTERTDDPLGGTQPILGIVYSSAVKRDVSEIGIRFCLHPTRAAMLLAVRETIKWKVNVLCNIITSSREHQALSHLPVFGLMAGHILAPPQGTTGVRDADLDSLLPVLIKRHCLNRPQARAICSALLDPAPFTLVQGPPGTGKTRVIEALVASMFSGPRSGFIRPAAHCKRVLICAPSNAAVDEIARRLMRNEQLKVVRIGSAEMIDDAVRPASLDVLVEEHVKLLLGTTTEQLQEHRQATTDLDFQLQMAEKANSGDVQGIKRSIWQARERIRRLTREAEEIRSSCRLKLLREANAVCCTLSGSGHDLILRLHQAQCPFEFVIIDEACQAVELSTLIPLQWGAKKCVLVGDPNQLPPTVLSQAAISGAYEQSLFRRLQRANPEQVLLLSVQYRMHPDIALFPSTFYYQSKLVNGPGLVAETTRPWHSISALGPYRFFDVPGQEERRSSSSGGRESKSSMNAAEAQMVVLLVAFLCHQFPQYSFRQKIGIITPYKEQKRKIQRELVKRFGSDTSHLRRAIEVSTVDGFQGQEREVIIFSCVRTGGHNQGVGFLNDARRINVALTRAKSSLYIVGRADMLRRHGLWRTLIDDARQRGVLVSYDESVWREMQQACGPETQQLPLNLK